MSSTDKTSVRNHVTIDFPINGPANANALRDVLPPLMPDFAKVQDDLGTVHFSRFMIKGDEKLLFLSDIDGDPAHHIERLVENAGPLLEAIFKHVDDPPAMAVGGPQRTIKWLTRHVREPMVVYFSNAEASVQDIKAAARAAGFAGNTSRGTLLTYMAVKSRVQGFFMKTLGKALLTDKGHAASDEIGTLHLAHFVPFEENHLAFFTVYDGDFGKYIQDFADKTSFTFDALFPNVVGGAPTPVAKNVQAFMDWAAANTYPPIGFYSAYPGLSVLDIRALLADRKSQSAA